MRKITGCVYDDENKPLMGVGVIVVGTLSSQKMPSVWMLGNGALRYDMLF